MNPEVVSPEGVRCFNYGVNENGQAECYWPECGCTPVARKTAFLSASKGAKSNVVAGAMNTLCRPIQVNWHGCSKAYMAQSFATGGVTQRKDIEFLKSLTVGQLREAIKKEIQRRDRG